MSFEELIKHNCMDEIDNLILNFISKPSGKNATEIIKIFNKHKNYNIGLNITRFVLPFFKYYIPLYEECALLEYNAENYEECIDMYQQILDMKCLDFNTYNKILFNRSLCIPYISDRYIYYNSNKIKNIKNNLTDEQVLPRIMFSITTCKRFELFEKTINSFINCVDIEHINLWYCIDDNSSEEDKIKMKEKYPFFHFEFKTPEEKGHPRSMNKIREFALENNIQYIFHMEDDWKFITKSNFIEKSLDVLENNEQIGQCLINKNYTETHQDITVKGGEYHQTPYGTRYYIHEYVYTDEQRNEWIKKHGHGLSSNYWPHFSFRPSLVRAEVLEKCGKFNENTTHFERDYANWYYHEYKYISAFLDTIYSIHIGRLTSEINDNTKINAYILNEEQQFGLIRSNYKQIEKLKTFVINLDRRPDRWAAFLNNVNKNLNFLNYEKFSAVDGKILQNSHQLQRIFDGNDYNMMVGAVGCALSHFKLYTKLIYDELNEYYLILEEDITLCDNFETNFRKMFDKLKSNFINFDIVFIGHHNKIINNNKNPQDINIELWDTYMSLNNSLGGTFGYIISKNGAIKLLDFINKNKMINCIDTMMQRSADELNVFYCDNNSQLVFSECVNLNSLTDSDIQRDKKSLTLTINDKINMELNYFQSISHNVIFINKLNYDEIDLINEYDNNIYYYYYNEINICIDYDKFYTYSFDGIVEFIINNKLNIDRNKHCFKNKNNEYNIESVLI